MPALPRLRRPTRGTWHVRGRRQWHDPSFTTLIAAKRRIFNDGPFAPASATPDMFEVLPGSGSFYGWANVRDDANIIGHSSVAVPGTVAGLCAALERYGTLSLKQVLAPAIELAEKGVNVDQRMTMIIAKEMRNFRRFPLLGALLLVDGLPPTPGTFWEPGDKLVYPELADTYRAIAENGAGRLLQRPCSPRNRG